MKKLRISKLFLICLAVGFCIVVFSGLMFLYRSGKKNVSMEGQSDIPSFSFKEEQRIWDKWFNENPDVRNLRDRMASRSRRGDEYIQSLFYGEIEKRFFSYADDQDKYITYVEVNIDNGIDRVVALIGRGNGWKRYYWIRDEVYHPTSLDIVEYSRKIEGKSLSLIEKMFSHNYQDDFIVGQDDRVLLLDGTSTYIVLVDGTKTVRITGYGIDNIESVISRSMDADKDIDRYVLAIKRQIDHALQLNENL